MRTAVKADNKTHQLPTDTLGRATFHFIADRPNVRPTERELRWLSFINRHGPLSSIYLHALTSDTHRDRDTSLRQLQKLRAGGLLHCPKQQRATENANFNPYIYDLTDRGREALIDADLDEAPIRPTGHWVHQFMTASITASIDMTARQNGISYIPGHKALERANAPLGVTIDKRKLIPDQLFGLDYGGQFRFFCVEADRGTEPKTSKAARKCYRRSIEQYQRFIGDKLYKDHYGLKCGLILLAVFSSRSNELRFLQAVEDVMGQRSAYIMTQTIPGFHGPFKPPRVMSELINGEWNRAAGNEAFQIGSP